jgi:hypothetical protein
MKPPQKLKIGLIELICQLFVRFVSFLTYQSGLLSRTCMASEANKLNDQNAEARSTYGSSWRSLFRAIGPGGFGPGRLSWAARRLSGAAARRPRTPPWDAAGPSASVKYRISHFSGRIYWHFSGQGPYFLTISAYGSNNILKFSAGRIFIYFLLKANVGTILNGYLRN